MIHVMLSEAYEGVVEPDHLVKAAEAVIKLQSADPQAEISIVVEDDDRLRELNRQFLGFDSPTDVLSFPADEVDPDSGQRYLGDIIISYPRAVEQAKAAAEEVDDELSLLVIHGTLHLLGFDHGSDDEKALMWAAQKAALDHIGCQITHLPE